MNYEIGNFYLRKGIVEGPVVWSHPILRSEYEMARSLSTKPVKPVLTGAFTLARHSIVEYPPYQKDFARLVHDYNEAIARAKTALTPSPAAATPHR